MQQQMSWHELKSSHCRKHLTGRNDNKIPSCTEMLMRCAYDLNNATCLRQKSTRSFSSFVFICVRHTFLCYTCVCVCLQIKHVAMFGVPSPLFVLLISLLALPNGLMDWGCIGSAQGHGDSCIIIIKLQEDVRNGSHCKVGSPPVPCWGH